MNKEQRYLYEILIDFSKICNVYNLRYFLVGGTLIGAIRHHDFIPWDDDIDVAMPIDDYNIFLSHSNELPSHYRLFSPKFDKDFPYFNTKIFNCKANFTSPDEYKGYGKPLDIFPFYPSRNPGRGSLFLYNILRVIGYVLMVKSGWTNFIPYKKLIARIGFRFLYYFPQKQIKRLRSIIIDMIAKENTDYCFSPGGANSSEKEFYPKKWFQKTVEVEFGGHHFPAPQGWDAYLTQLYGDYMTPIEESGNPLP